MVSTIVFFVIHEKIFIVFYMIQTSLEFSHITTKQNYIKNQVYRIIITLFDFKG